MGSLFDDLPATLPAELTDVLAEGEHVRIERIVSTGHSSPDGFWYDQDRHEWVCVLKGEATLEFNDGESLQMSVGDHVLIPPHRKHRVVRTAPDEQTVWLAVFW